MDRERVELLLDAIARWDPDLIGDPRDRDEIYLKAIAGKDPSLIGYPRDRYEIFVKAISEAVGSLGGVDDSVIGWDVLYQAENLTFNGTNSTFVDTGVKILSAAYADKDIKIVIKGFYFKRHSSTYDTILACKYEVDPWPGLKIGLGAFGTTNTADITVGDGTRIDELVIHRYSGVWTVDVFNSMNSHFLEIAVPDFNVALQNDQNLVLGGATKADGSGQRYAEGSFGSIVVAVK